jgi:hypothetical protein
MDFPPLIIRHDIELSVSKTNFSFLKHLFCWYEENEFSYYLYKRIAYQIQVPTNDKERRYLCFNQAYQYLLKHAQESDKQIIIKTFFVMLFDHNVSIEGIENLFDKFGKKIHSFGFSLVMSSIYQALGFGFGKIISNVPKDPTKWLTIGDIGSYLWGIPAVKTGVIRFAGGVAGSILNDIF